MNKRRKTLLKMEGGIITVCLRPIGLCDPWAEWSLEAPCRLPDDFPNEKRAPDGAQVSVLVIQLFVTPL